MQQINPDSENILILAVTGTVLSGIWLAYKLNLFKVISTIDEKKILLPSFLFLISPFLFPFIFKIIFNNNMLSQPTAINGGILGAVIAGIFLMINTQWMTSVNNKLQLEREEQQRSWQLEREKEQRIWQLEREKQQSIWQDESEQKKWYREKIYDSYRKSIELLTKLIQAQLEFEIEFEKFGIFHKDKKTNLNNLGIEFLSEFNLLTIGHPNREYEEFKKKQEKIIKATLEKKFQVALEVITEIIENDSRIKDVNK